MAEFHSHYYSDVHHLFEEIRLLRLMLLLQRMLSTLYQVTQLHCYYAWSMFI